MHASVHAGVRPAGEWVIRTSCARSGPIGRLAAGVVLHIEMRNQENAALS
jgi:hypothetical protein